jgi:hypothetical protein
MMMMRRSMLVSMTAMVVVLFATTHAMGVEWPEGNIPWEIGYEADVLPVSVSPPWTMVEHGSVRGGLLTEDGVSFLRIDTLDSGWAQAYFMAPGVKPDFESGALVMLRARVHAGTTHQGGILIGGEQGYVSMAFVSSHLRFDTDSGPKYKKISDLIGEWHEYRLVVQGDSYIVYVDDDTEPIYTGAVVTDDVPEIDADVPKTGLLFGDMRGSRMIKVDYDYIRYAPLSKADGS